VGVISEMAMNLFSFMQIFSFFCTRLKISIKLHEMSKTVSIVSFISRSLCYLNGIHLSKFGLLIDRTSSRYLIMRLKVNRLLHTFLGKTG
jgi:hypothetical protein